jgi:cell wall-associated NlpC family hydrolase
MNLTSGEKMGSERMPMKIYLNLNPCPVFPFFCILIVVALILNTVSCTTKKMQHANTSHVTPQTRRPANADDREKRILYEYKQWRGTNHKMGGTGSKGIDCSGFVQAIYRDAFNIDLPRTTKAQVRLGKPVSVKELQSGDLVFFKPPTYARHVGIFLSQSEFVHASKNKGVTVSKIDAYYWGKYYWTARRILPDR